MERSIMTNNINNIHSIMVFNKPVPPKRFHNIEDIKYLKYKIAKDKRNKQISKDRWAKLNREDMVQEKMTRNEIWENYITELAFR